jgi:hypothetical protein
MVALFLPSTSTAGVSVVHPCCNLILTISLNRKKNGYSMLYPAVLLHSRGHKDTIFNGQKLKIQGF